MVLTAVVGHADGGMSIGEFSFNKPPCLCRESFASVLPHKIVTISRALADRNSPWFKVQTFD